MTRQRLTRTRTLTLVAGLAATLIAPLAAAQSAPATSDDKSVTEIRTVEDGTRYEVVIRGDRVEARVDGLRLAPDRVVREDRRIVLLDDAGNRMKVIAMAPQPPAPPAMGIGSAPRLRVDVEGQIEPPPVMLGVLLEGASEALQAQLGVSPHAILVERVLDGLPAHRAGLERWDIIIEADGDVIDEAGMLHDILMSSDPGDVLDVVVLRKGEEVELEITLDAYDARALANTETGLSGTARFPGVTGLEQLGFNWHQRGMEDAKRALEEAARSLQGQTGQEMEQARRQIEEAMRQFEQQSLRPGANVFSWRLDDQGRLFPSPAAPPAAPALPGGPPSPGGNAEDGRLDRLERSFNERLTVLEREFDQRMEQFEGRWGDIEDMLGRMFERLERSIERRLERDENRQENPGGQPG